MDDADPIAELLGFTHDMCREDNRFAAFSAFANEIHDRPGADDVEARGWLIEDHHRRIVNERASDGNPLLDARGESLAAAIAKGIDIQPLEKREGAPAGARPIQTMKAAEVFHHLEGRQAAVQGGSCRKKAQVLASFFGLLPNIKTGNASGARGGREDGSEQTQSSRLASAVCAEQTVNLSRGAVKGEILDRANYAPLFVSKFFAETFGFDHSVAGDVRGIIRPES